MPIAGLQILWRNAAWSISSLVQGSCRCSSTVVKPKKRFTAQDNSSAQVERLLQRISSLQLFPGSNPRVLVALTKRLGRICQAREGSVHRQRAQQRACARVERATAVCVHLLRPQQVLTCLSSFPHFSRPPRPDLLRLLLLRLAEDECSHFRQLPPESVSHIAWALARLQAKLHTELRPLLQVSSAFLSQLHARHVALLLWALAHLQYADPSLIGRLTTHARERVAEWGLWDATNLVWAMVITRNPDPLLCHALVAHAKDNHQRFNSKQLAVTAWALGVWDMKEEKPLMQQLLETAQQLLARFTSKELANMLWASTSLQAPHPGLLQQLCSQPEPLVRKCGASDMATIMFSLAQQNHYDALLADCAADRFCQLLTVQAQEEHGVGNGRERGVLSAAYAGQVHQSVLAWNRSDVGACNKREREEGGNVGEVGGAAAGSPSLVSVRACSNILWSMARMRHYHERLLRLATAHIAAQFSSIGPTELLQVCWSCATLAFYSAKLVKCLDSYWPTLSPILTAPQMIHVAWSCTVMQHFNADFYNALFRSLRDRGSEQLPSASLCQLFQVCVILHGAFRLSSGQGFRPPGLPSRLLRKARRQWIAQNRSVVSFVQRDMHEALVRLGFQPLLEFATSDGVFNIDIALQRHGLHLAVEVDGPTHFTSNGPIHRPLGPTLSRWQCLEDRGWCVVSIRAQDWTALPNVQQKEQLLMDTLAKAVEHGSKDKADELLRGGRLGRGSGGQALAEVPKGWTTRDLIKLVE